MVSIREVGPRDGLQPEAPVPVAARVALIEGLVAAGVSTIEVAAFVSPKAVPAMAGAAEVLLRGARYEGVTYVALVPNVKGAELARAGVEALTLTVSASRPTARNVGMSVGRVAGPGRRRAVRGGRWHAARHRGLDARSARPTRATSTRARWRRSAGEALASGASAVTYADTTGMATPGEVAEVVDATGPDVGLHLHDGAPHSSTPMPPCTWGCRPLRHGRRRAGRVAVRGGRTRQPGHRGPGAPVRRPGRRHRHRAEALLTASARVAEVVQVTVPSRVAAAGPPRSRLHPGWPPPGRAAGPPALPPPPSPMPWCETCSRFLNPQLARAGRLVPLRSGGGQAHDGGEELPGAPWHFKLLLVAVVIYLGWRLIQLIGWIVT